MTIVLGESLGKIWTGGRNLCASADHWSAEKASQELIEGVVKVAGVALMDGLIVGMRRDKKSLFEVFCFTATLALGFVQPGIALTGVGFDRLLNGVFLVYRGAVLQDSNTFLRGVLSSALGAFDLKYADSNHSILKNCWGERKIQELSSYCAPKLASMFHKKSG